MSVQALTVGGDSLIELARAYFSRVYQQPAFVNGARLSKDVEWDPTFYFKTSNHLVIAVEVSESVFPVILRRKRTSLEEIPFPVSVYSVCPEEEYHKNAEEAKELFEAGIGLVTIAADGRPHQWHAASSVQLLIKRGQFEPEIEDLPKKIRQKLSDSYQRYGGDPLSGVRDVTEVFEGIIRQAAKAAKRLGHIQCDPVRDNLDTLIDKFIRAPTFARSGQVLWSARGYIAQRNTNHHPPRSAKAEAKRLRDTRHAFFEGLKQITAFVGAMGLAGIRPQALTPANP